MTESTLWWLLTGTAVAVELATGTFYLLMLAVGFAAAALSAHMGGSFTVQMTAAALVGVGSVLIWRKVRRVQPPTAAAQANPDVNMDIGQTVNIDQWSADGTATAKYRGAQWSVVHLATPVKPAALTPGLYRVVQVVGSQLMVDKV